jgi:hypothetical protein
MHIINLYDAVARMAISPGLFESGMGRLFMFTILRGLLLDSQSLDGLRGDLLPQPFTKGIS